MSDKERDREFYRKRIQEIVERPTLDYWTGIKEYPIGRVRWIGRPGYSASVEAWIWKILQLLKSYSHLASSDHWFVRCWSSSREKSSHNHLYFAFHHKPDEDFRGELVACGGATNYSGEGGYAKAIAEAFMEYVIESSHGVVRILDHEIGYLIEYMLEG